MAVAPTQRDTFEYAASPFLSHAGVFPMDRSDRRLAVRPESASAEINGTSCVQVCAPPGAVCTIHTTDSASLIKQLRKAGFEVMGIRGSHHKLRNADNVTVIVPHPKKDLGKGIVAAILKQAGL